MELKYLNHISPGCVEAIYSPQRMPHFKGKVLIEALPPSMNDADLFAALSLSPDFSDEQRSWDVHERMYMLGTLQNFMVPLTKHFELARALDSMMRNGYIGREPETAEAAEIRQTIYGKQSSGVGYQQMDTSRTTQSSTALIGISGMGKTTAVKRYLAHIPRVIYHPTLNIYQVPYLHVEMPSDGSSIKGLATGILQKIDELIPGANYFKTYAKGKFAADTLMRHVAHVLHMHYVGLLVCDEVQNLANSAKGAQTVMTELVSACNDLKIPILLIGTNKAARVLRLDFRQARRSSGYGIEPWDRFHQQAEPGKVHEWRDFMEILWEYQWIQQPVPLTESMLDLVYECSQGIIDIVIKLFASAQARAISDGSETLTEELFLSVYNDELKLLHPMLNALRNDDMEALAKFDDIAPINFDDMLDNFRRKIVARASPLYSVKSGDVSFSPRIATSLVAMGLEPEEAFVIADKVNEGKPGKTLIAGLTESIKAVSSPLKSTRKVRAKADENPLPEGLEALTAACSERPDDYRNAILDASQNRTTVLEALIARGMAKPLQDILDLS